MSVECFREAVRSLKDWPGVIGIFGGNPCNHPKFPELCAILVEEIPEQKHRGLWSNDLLGHGEVAMRTFYPNGRFNLNAHGLPGPARVINHFLPGRLIPGSDVKTAEHSAILAHYADLGLSKAEWEAARETCDINQKWSGAIVERDGKPYAYFCEVAAAIDGTRGTNFGLPVVPGWWEESMRNSYFGNQVKMCCDSGCGVPLRIKGHRDNEEVYDISATWGDLKPRGTVTTQIIDKAEHVWETTDYMRARK